MNQLEELKKVTTIVADTSDFKSIAQYLPQDATTNPTLIYQGCQNSDYLPLVDEAIVYAKQHATSTTDILPLALDKTFVNFGLEILKQIPGRVSIEIDARLSFDINKSVDKAKAIIALFEAHHIDRSRILIKLASTWEGIMAAKKLEKENIKCNMTLLFSLPQAIACATVKATLISPFVGRILDWYKKKENKDQYLPHEDPGVLSVTQIYNYYKKFGYSTQIMGASFRNKEEILQLAGCDLLTIAPKFLEELKNTLMPVEKKLNTDTAKTSSMEKIKIDEPTFRYLLNQDGMATEKLSEGIRIFVSDITKLEKEIEKRIHI
jgi:transaldolase